jgi:CRP-like cAMP-binding protein
VSPKKSGININEVNACTIDITRDGIASIAGTANETVSRMLSDFKEEKLISKEKGKILYQFDQKSKGCKTVTQIN